MKFLSWISFLKKEKQISRSCIVTIISLSKRVSYNKQHSISVHQLDNFYFFQISMRYISAYKLRICNNSKQFKQVNIAIFTVESTSSECTICFRGNVHDFERGTLADNSGELTDSEILGEIQNYLPADVHYSLLIYCFQRGGSTAQCMRSPSIMRK